MPINVKIRKKYNEYEARTRMQDNARLCNVLCYPNVIFSYFHLLRLFFLPIPLFPLVNDSSLTRYQKKNGWPGLSMGGKVKKKKKKKERNPMFDINLGLVWCIAFSRSHKKWKSSDSSWSHYWFTVMRQFGSKIKTEKILTYTLGHTDFFSEPLIHT